MNTFTLSNPVEHDRVAEWDDDPTPRGTVAAVLREALPVLFAVIKNTEIVLGLPRTVCRLARMGSMETRPLNVAQPFRVLDLGAGFGSWSSEFAKWWTDDLGLPREWLHITAIEINPKRDGDLRKWCDEVITRDWFDALRDHHELPTWDLVISNPPFGELLSGEPGGGYELEDVFSGPDWPLGMPGWLLEHAPAVLLLHTQQAFVKSEAGRACWRRHPPAASWLVPGGVGFRGPGNGADSRCYQVTLWLRSHTGPCSVSLLDDLTAAQRKWTTPPGSESPEWARENGYPLAPGYEGACG